jgi:hypothetical protein
LLARNQKDTQKYNFKNYRRDFQLLVLEHLNHRSNILRLGITADVVSG